jgi:hypothetical protein
MKISSFLLAFILFVNVPTFSQKTFVTYYPHWFLFPEGNKNFVVGYSAVDTNALYNAAKRKAYLDSCNAKGRLYYYEETEDRGLNKHSDYYYYYSEEDLNFYLSRLVLRDEFVINVLTGDTVFLFSMNDSVKFNASLVRIDTLPQPTWINETFFDDENFYYGVGSYTLLGRDNDAWISSEENAVFNIVRSLVHRFASVSIKVNNNGDFSSETVQSIEINAKLKNIYILARYPDYKRKLYFTLVKISKADIKAK